MSSAHGERIWFHCASLGEFEQARPLIEKIRKEKPEHHLILTFFSPSGFEVRQFYNGVDFVGYLPLDTEENAKRYINRLKPTLVIWVKYEFWFNFLNELHRQNIPVVLISSVFRADHIFFKWYGSLHIQMLGFFRKIFVQNEASQNQLKTINVDSQVCRDTRFDSVFNVLNNHKLIESAAAFKGDKKIFIAGSTWEKDVDLICDMINADPFEGQYKYIIAPHDVSKKNIDYIISKITKKKALFSRINTGNGATYEVAIVDTIGLLSSLYYYGDISYIGGGFDASIHNILEPAVYGMPVIFGPNHHKSEEAKTMLSHSDWHAAHTVKNSEELISTIRSLLANDGAHLKTGAQKAKEYVLSNRGGTDKIYNYLIDQHLL